jgi:site-specific DNA-methyltransferase (adenine-specific)
MEFIKEYPIEKLKVWENNPRKNDKSAYKLINVIKEYGFINPIVIDQNGVIRAGHTRLKAANRLGQKTVPVIIYDFKTEAQAIGYSIADNKSSEWADWDFDELKDVLQELSEMNFDLEKTGFDLEEAGNIFLKSDEEDICLEELDGSIQTGKSKSAEEKLIKCPKCGFEMKSTI